LKEKKKEQLLTVMEFDREGLDCNHIGGNVDWWETSPCFTFFEHFASAFPPWSKKTMTSPTKHGWWKKAENTPLVRMKD
jgi:hypothetical protein